MAAIPDNYGTGGTGLDPTGTDSQPSLALCLRDVADDLAELRTALVAVTAQLDSEMSLDESLELINDIRAKFIAHMALTSSHPNADTTNVVTAPVATDLASGYTLANDLKVQINAHFLDLSSLEEAITLVNDQVTQYEAHRVYDTGSVHNGSPDTTNVVTAAVATDLATAITRANDLKAMYEAHRVLATTHTNPDATNTIAAADASDLATLKTLLNEYSVDHDAHIILTAGPVHGGADAVNGITEPDVDNAAIHTNDDVTNIVAAADATTAATLVTLANELSTDYEAHRALATSHSAADTTNVIQEGVAGSNYAANDPAALKTTKA